jgi:4-hydroxy-3-methylbut-2-en-1-yl diphosphate synthase IspG/GcpE
LQNGEIDIPLRADVHISPSIAIACTPFIDKMRVNPVTCNANFEIFRTLIKSGKKERKAIRIGINRGSLSKNI